MVHFRGNFDRLEPAETVPQKAAAGNRLQALPAVAAGVLLDFLRGNVYREVQGTHRAIPREILVGLSGACRGPSPDTLGPDFFVPVLYHASADRGNDGVCVRAPGRRNRVRPDVRNLHLPHDRGQYFRTHRHHGNVLASAGYGGDNGTLRGRLDCVREVDQEAVFNETA